jgi:hypothetical protein
MYKHKIYGYLVNEMSSDKNTVKGAYLDPVSKTVKIKEFNKSELMDAKAPAPKEPTSTGKKVIKGEKGINITDETEVYIAKGKTVKTND